MTLLIDQLVEPIWEYSPLEEDAFIFISESALAKRSKEIRGMALPGVKNLKGAAFFFKNARALAKIALERTTATCPVGAVLFRDCDGTRSMGNNLWQEKWDSISRGFEAENFLFGVAMLPKPKSEVWLLCALQKNPYDHCEKFEEISGNDASPASAKKRLDEALTARQKSIHDVCDLMKDGTIRAGQIDMSSYNEFRKRLEQVATALAGQTSL